MTTEDIEQIILEEIQRQRHIGADPLGEYSEHYGSLVVDGSLNVRDLAARIVDVILEHVGQKDLDSWIVSPSTPSN